MAEDIQLKALTGEEFDEVDPDTRLAHTLGIDLDQDDEEFRTFIDYVDIHRSGRRPRNEFLQLFAEILTYMREDDEGVGTATIQSCIDHLVGDRHHFYFQDTRAHSDIRAKLVKDTVLLILGLWTLTLSYFVTRLGHEPHLLETCSSETPLAQPLRDLISKSGLLPNPKEVSGANSNGISAGEDQDQDSSATPLFNLHSAMDLVGSLSISTKKLNLFKLTIIAGVQVLWTDNISRHMLLSQRGSERYIELFSLPCAIKGGAGRVLSDTAGISAALMEEIELSYAGLFNPQPASKVHQYAGMLFALPLWCWCISCSSARLRKSYLVAKTPTTGVNTTPRWDGFQYLYDPRLKQLAEEKPQEWWNCTTFENLWPRILALDDCLREARPWSFWVLLRDNRNTVQYWTFLFGTLVLVLTIMQVILGLVQTTQR